MSLFFVAGLARESSETLLSEVREVVGDRKILRFLNPNSLPAFACAVEAASLLPDVDPQRLTLFTVSGWESMKEFAPAGLDGATGTRDELRRLFYNTSNPTFALSMLNNAPLCQAGIATRIQGPSMHVMGDGTAALRLLVIAAETFRENTAEAAIVVAFDVDGNGARASRARAIVLSPNAQGARAALEVESPAAAGGNSAVATLSSCIDAAERLESDESVAVSFGDRVAVRVRRVQ